MDKTTPTPWSAVKLNPDGIIIKKEGWEIATYEYDVCATRPDGAPIRKEADARLIVRAVNAFEPLVEACEDILAHSAYFISGDRLRIRNKVEAALLLANQE